MGSTVAGHQGGLILPGASPSLAVVRGADGIPLPPTEIVEAIKRVCGQEFGLRFASGLAGVGWDVTRDWPEHDRRREWIRNGNYDPACAYDRIGSLPFGCSLAEAPSYMERMLKDYPMEHVSRLRERMHHWNQTALPAAQVEEATVATMEQVASAQRAPKGQLVVSHGKGRRRKAE